MSCNEVLYFTYHVSSVKHHRKWIKVKKANNISNYNENSLDLTGPLGFCGHTAVTAGSPTCPPSPPAAPHDLLHQCLFTLTGSDSDVFSIV